jgi:hypothetical protein
LRPDKGAILVQGFDANRGGIVSHHELASARRVIGKEEEAGHRIGIHVTFEPHVLSPQHIKDDAVSIVNRRLDGFPAGLDNQLEEITPVQLVEPGQGLLDRVRVYPATRDMRYVLRFTGQEGRARKLSEISLGGNCADIILPIFGKLIGHIKCRP